MRGYADLRDAGQSASGANYGQKIRLALEHMFDPVRAQNAAASGLINSWPDPETGDGFHAKYSDGQNRKAYDAALTKMGRRGVPDVAILGSRFPDLPDYLKRHIDNSQMKRISQHAYSVRKLNADDIALVTCAVLRVEVTSDNIAIIREMREAFVSKSGPRPWEVDDILVVEDLRIPAPPEPPLETLFPEDRITGFVHLWPRDGESAFCGSHAKHSCDALASLGYQLSYTDAITCACGTPICQACRMSQEKA